MELTREQAITEHRKMWKWISRQIMKDYVKYGKVKSIFEYKSHYVHFNHQEEFLKNRCFCCEYVKNLNGTCRKDCPLYWNDKNTEIFCTDYYGYYAVIKRIRYAKFDVDGIHYCISEHDAKRLSRMAYKIAMLEERKDNV